MDNHANALLVWSQDDGEDTRLVKRWYPENSYTNNNRLGFTPTGMDVYQLPSVAMNGNSNTGIAWVQKSGSDSIVFKSELRNSSWVHPTSLHEGISFDMTPASSPKSQHQDHNW